MRILPYIIIQLRKTANSNYVKKLGPFGLFVNFTHGVQKVVLRNNQYLQENLAFSMDFDTQWSAALNLHIVSIFQNDIFLSGQNIINL